MRYFFAALLAAMLLCFALPAALAEDGTAPSPSPSFQPEPTQEPSGAPGQADGPARLYIDNTNLYEHMTKTYSQGYVPVVKGGTATIVLPLQCQSELRGGILRARAVLEAGGPFVTKNYEQTVELKTHKVNGGKGRAECYCVVFSLQLEGGRVNGSYPVTIAVAGTDIAGGEVREEFQLYVNISDGKDPNATPKPEPVPTPSPEPPVVLGPKVLVQSCVAISLEEDAQDGVVNAGDHIRVTVTLINTSQSQALENMAVTAASPGEGFALLSASDSVYIGALPAGGTVDVVYDYQVAPETPAGQYGIPLSYDYAYNKGETGSGAGSARVNISQPLDMEFSLSRMPAEAVVSDVVEANVQAINLSHAKAYNVRAVIEGDGLLPSGTAFIGDLEGGTSGEKPLQVTITGLTSSDTPYGPASGTVTYLYEDGDGREYTQTGSFNLDIKSPFSEEKPKEKDDPGQFWIVMGAVGVVLLGLIGVLVLRAARRRGA